MEGAIGAMRRGDIGLNAAAKYMEFVTVPYFGL